MSREYILWRLFSPNINLFYPSIETPMVQWVATYCQVLNGHEPVSHLPWYNQSTSCQAQIIFNFYLIIPRWTWWICASLMIHFIDIECFAFTSFFFFHFSSRTKKLCARVLYLPFFGYIINWGENNGHCKMTWDSFLLEKNKQTKKLRQWVWLLKKKRVEENAHHLHNLLPRLHILF